MAPSTTLQRARAWLAHDPDEHTRAELTALLNDPAKADELADRFAGPLEFGTAGLRGLIGAGENRMNRAVVRRTTWGLGTQLLAHRSDEAPPLVVIGFDGRVLSDTFARDAALVLTALGCHVHLFDGLGPTPLLAFAVGLGASAGIMVTASHNPPAYNGYKVYWSRGSQIVPPVDGQIAARIAEAAPADEILLDDFDSAVDGGRLRLLGGDMRDRYLAGVAQLSRPGGDRNFKIVYTALHGVGDQLCRTVLAQAGFTHVVSVAEQQLPDGAFPTVAFPNPEEKGAMDLALALGRSESADLIIANDPDADRLAVAIPDPGSPTHFRQLTGNEVGVLLGHHLLTREPWTQPHAVLASIVSSPMLGVIAHQLGARYEETLTGFKWIEHRALEIEAESGAVLAFGYEEALGYGVGTLVRDKDGISAAVVFAELVAGLRATGQGVADRLNDLYRQYGLFVSGQVSITKPGQSGAEEIAAMMTRLRAHPPTELAGKKVVARSDYQEQMRTVGDRAEKLALPPSNVLAFALEGGSRVIARPSGTEPKIKLYFDVRESVGDGEPLDEARTRADALMLHLKEEFTALAKGNA